MFWHVRALAGVIFAAGMLVFVYNVLMTIAKGKALAAKAGEQPAPAAA
jgi:cytochrome c oxidase cbb3-type subunit 1